MNTQSITSSSKTSSQSQLPNGTGSVHLWERAATLLDKAIPEWLIALLLRAGIAAVFWQSGRTKVEGWLSVTDNAIALFRDEYKLPLVPPEIAAYAGAYAEHLLPLLLVLGLGTRWAALGLLGMTAVIQTLVYPDAWPTHLSWAAPLLYLVARGGGTISLDNWFRLK